MPTLNFDIGQTAQSSGDVVKIKFDNPIKNIKSINDFSDSIGGKTDNRFFKKYFRWSPDQSYSAWIDLTLSNLQDIPFDLGQDIWLEFKYERAGSDDSGELVVEDIILDYEVHSTSEDEPEPKPCPISSSEPNYTAGIKVNCDKNLIKPNELLSSASALYDQLNSAVTEMYGVCIQYVKIDPVKDSQDDLLKEYSVFKADDIKEIKVIIPDGEVPNNEFEYSAFDMGFMGEADFEIQVPKEHFERAFGHNSAPQENDIIYIPFMNKMWEVNSSVLGKGEFSYHGSYYRLKLVKRQDKKNVILDNNEQVADTIDDLSKDFEEEFGEQRTEEEIQKVTKPEQYKTISIGKYDHIRKLINKNLKIINEELSNYFTVVAKYHYDLTTIDHNEVGIVYKQNISVKETQDRAITLWFKYMRQEWDNTYPTYDVLIDGSTGSSGFYSQLNYNHSKEQPESIQVTLNGQDFIFDQSFPKLNRDTWYSVVINLSNTHEQLSTYIWELKSSDKQTTDLKLIFNQTFDITKYSVKMDNRNWRLIGGTLNLTNIRIFKNIIEPEKQPLVLNQYVVDDSHLSLLVDNAIPALTFDRVSNP